MAGLSRAVTEAIMETRWEYFGGNIDSTAQCQTSKGQEDSWASCLPPQQGLLLSQEGTESSRIQAIDCGLITSEDILINHQIPELPCLSFPVPSRLQPPLSPEYTQETSANHTMQQRLKAGFSQKK